MNKPSGLKNGLVLENLFVTKLTSLNPDEYEFMGLTTAIAKYGKYCAMFARSRYNLDDTNLKSMKNFDDWCLTEI